MRAITVLFTLLAFSIIGSGQSDLQKLVDTEHAFARFAAEKGTKSAFLEYLTVDGLVFVPDKANGKTFWRSREESPSLLSWAPNYADISANGILGYTTGNWELRAKGKDDVPSAFGEFITIWLRQPDKGYKFVIDIGVSHDRPAKYSSEWVTAADKETDLNAKNSSAADIVYRFFEIANQKGLAKAYEAFAAPEIRMFREDKFPTVGKKNVLAEVKKQTGTVNSAKRSVFFGSGNIAYTNNTYTGTKGGKVVEKGNFVQIWKLRAGRWQIVLDIFKHVP